MSNYRYEKLYYGPITNNSIAPFSSPLQGEAFKKKMINRVEIVCSNGSSAADTITMSVSDDPITAIGTLIRQLEKATSTTGAMDTLFNVGGSGLVLTEGDNLIINCGTNNGVYNAIVYGAVEDV